MIWWDYQEWKGLPVRYILTRQRVPDLINDDHRLHHQVLSPMNPQEAVPPSPKPYLLVDSILSAPIKQGRLPSSYPRRSAFPSGCRTQFPRVQLLPYSGVSQYPILGSSIPVSNVTNPTCRTLFPHVV